MNNVVPFKTGNHMKPHPADDLSFMRRRKLKGTGIEYWAVKGSGNYSSDYSKGKTLAMEFMSYVAENNIYGNTTLLAQIVSGMVDQAVQRPEGKASASRLTGLEIGFLNTVGKCANAAAGIIELSGLVES